VRAAVGASKPVRTNEPAWPRGALTRDRVLRTIDSMWKPRKPHVGDEYVTGSFRDGIFMIVVILIAITLIWLAYGWALGVPGAPAAP
jgi:hypothetical protein